MRWRCNFCSEENLDPLCSCGKTEMESDLEYLRLLAELEDQEDSPGGGLGSKI